MGAPPLRLRLAGHDAPLALTRLAAPSSAVGVSVLPLANVFLSLIPFLLLCSTATPLAATQLALPAVSGGAAPDERVRVTLHIRPAAYLLEARSMDSRGERMTLRVPRGRASEEDGGGAPSPYAQLADACERVRERFASSQTVHVVP